MDSNETRREWAERSGEYSPEYYAHYGPDETSESIRDILDRFVSRDASILELGCSSGRHLSHLYEHGFSDLTGIEINDEAFDVMDDAYPDLADDGTFYLGAIEDLVEQFESGQFDAVYSVETLQHIHPDAEWVFGEISRITDELLITVENEGGVDHPRQTDTDVNYVNGEFPLYYRDWDRIFSALGFTEVDSTSGKRDTIRVFRSSRKTDRTSQHSSTAFDR